LTGELSNTKAAGCHGDALSAVTVLLIDNEEYSMFYRELIRQWGYSVIHVKNIREGKQTLENLAPDMIMLGDDLSDGCGFEFCKELRRTWDIPIILIDCNKADIRVSAGLDMGADEYFPKHCSFDYVKIRVDNYLKPAVKRAGRYAEKTPARSRFDLWHVKWMNWINS